MFSDVECWWSIVQILNSSPTSKQYASSYTHFPSIYECPTILPFYVANGPPWISSSHKLHLLAQSARFPRQSTVPFSCGSDLSLRIPNLPPFIKQPAIFPYRSPLIVPSPSSLRSSTHPRLVRPHLSSASAPSFPQHPEQSSAHRTQTPGTRDTFA